MEIANIIVAFLALVVAILAIFISIFQAKKSDNIALMSLRIDFYNKLCEFIEQYKIAAKFKLMITANNSDKIFSQGKNTPFVPMLLSYLGAGNPVSGLEKIVQDINYLDVNKYLFNEGIIAKINEIINLLNEFKTAASTCFAKDDKKCEEELQKVLNILSENLDKAEDDLMKKVKNSISIKKKLL